MEKSRSGETILTITLALLLVYILRERQEDWLLYTAVAFGATGLLWKWFRYQVHDFWFWLAEKLGFVVSRIVLGIVFLVIVVPFGLVSRLFRKDLMHMKKGGTTYFHPRNHRYAKEDMTDPW